MFLTSLSVEMLIRALILLDTELNGSVPCLWGLEEEENLLPRPQEAQQFLAILDRDDYFNCTSCAPPVIKTGIKGRPEFFIPREQLQYLKKTHCLAYKRPEIPCHSRKSMLWSTSPHSSLLRTLAKMLLTLWVINSSGDWCWPSWAIRDLTQNTTATATRTSPNKRFNMQNNSCARTL